MIKNPGIWGESEVTSFSINGKAYCNGFRLPNDDNHMGQFSLRNMAKAIILRQPIKGIKTLEIAVTDYPLADDGNDNFTKQEGVLYYISYRFLLKDGTPTKWQQHKMVKEGESHLPWDIARDEALRNLLSHPEGVSSVIPRTYKNK